MLFFVTACVLPAFLVSFAVTGLMRILAPRWGFVDRPAARKVHSVPTPLGGGVGIVTGFVVTIVMAYGVVVWLSKQPTIPSWLPAEIAQHVPGVLSRASQMGILLAAGIVLAIMGLIDDRRGLSWKVRLAVQFGLAIALVVAGIQATVFIAYPWIGQVVTVLWMVVLINSFNFLDNMDALSSGIGLIASVMFAAVMLFFVSEPRWFVGGALLALAGSLAGFLCHNWPPAKIFMGDAGSTFIGLTLASLTVVGTFYDQNSASSHVILAPLCILAIPLYDIVSVIFIRLSEGRSPFQPDKKHFSHRLVEMGLSRQQAVLTVHLVTITTGIGGLVLYRILDWTGAFFVVAMVLCLLTIVAILETVGRGATHKNGERALTESPPRPDIPQ